MTTIQIVHDDPGAFATMQQEGVGVEGTVGVDQERFLTQSLRISEEYLLNRIQTIFLNAKPVDDPVSTRLFPGDVVALSAYLPGNGRCYRTIP